MKLKKILASLTAAAMAVTTMAIAPVSAAESTSFPFETGEWTNELRLTSYGTIQDEEKAELWLKYTSTDTAQWGSQLMVMDNNGTEVIPSTNLPVASSESFAFSVPYSSVADGMLVKGWNSTVTGYQVVYSTGLTSSIGESTGEGYANNIAIPDSAVYSAAEYIAVDYTSGSSNYSQLKIVSADWSTVYVDGAGVNNTTEGGTAYFKLDGYAGGGLFIQGHNVTINSITSYVTSIDTTEYAEQEITETFDTEYGVMNFEGTFDASKINGSSARIEVTFKPNDTNAGIKLIDMSTDPVDWNGITMSNSDGTTNEQTVSFNFSKFTVPEKMTINTWGIESISKVVIFNDKTKGNVYSASVDVDSVTITPATLKLTVGDEKTLTAAVLPENATDKTVEWSSSYETVAKVDENGKVTAVAEGTATITATAGNKTAECKVTVSAKTYHITVEPNDKKMGTASANVTEAKKGDTVTLTAEAKDGYRFVKWESEQVEIEDDSFKMPEGEVTVTAVFEADTYALTITAENGTVTATADGEAVDGEAVAGSTIKLTQKADEGYRFVKWESEDVKIEDDSFKMPEGEVTVTAVFEADTYALTITAKNGTVTAKADGAAVDGEAVAGSKIVLDKTADEGYKFDKWISDDVTIVDGSFTMPAKDVAIEAVFVEMEADEFNITVDKNIKNGTVAVKGGATAAKAGDTITLSVTPDTGCELVSLTVNGEAIEGASFTMPEKDVVISAVFKKIDYTVTVSESENGKASADKATAQYGDTVTLTAVPEEGYALVSYETTPKDLAISENGTFKMPAENVEIKAVFARDTFKVTVIPPENGTISVDKYSAKPGDTVTVTVTPNEGYKVHAICVNDEAIEGTSFTMPAEDVVVSVIFESEGSADTSGGTSPGGITVNFEDPDDVLEAVFGENWLDLVDAGEKLSVEMTVLDEVPAEDKTTVEDYLSDDQYLGVILDINLIKTVNGTSTEVTECSKPITFSIDVPADIIAEGRTYSVVRVHDGAAQNIGGTFDSNSNTITVSSDKFSTYAIVYDEAPVEEEPVPEPEVKPVVYYSITSDRNVRTSISSASAGTIVTVTVDFGYDAIVYCGGTRIARITDRGTFVMPAGNVRIVTEANGYLAMIRKAAPNSYIFVYDSEMNYIKTNGSRKGIEGEGTITVKLGEEYAGKTVTLYKGRKSTAVEIDSAVLDENGNATFTVEGGKNYTAVVE